jgi:hypothetical protein
MAYTRGFQNDIFISYSHVDNLVPDPSRDGWVDQFRQNLETSLGQLVGQPDAVKIWYDSNLRPGQIFDEVRAALLKDSAIFLAVTSPDYVESDYCREELRSFHEEIANDALSPMMDNEARVFNVLVSDAPHSNWPPEFGSRLGYNFYDEGAGAPRRVGDPTFEHTLTTLAEDILEILNTLNESYDNEAQDPAGSAPLDEQPDSGAPETGELVFLSYARADQQFSLELATKAKQLGVKIWVDQWDIPASADWDRSIDEALGKCDRLLIVLSPASVNSDEVRSELRWALDQKKPVVPVLYQECTIPRRLLLTQYVDFRSVAADDEAKLKEVVEALRSASHAEP